MDGMIRGEHLKGQDNWTEEQLAALVMDAIEALGVASMPTRHIDLMILGRNGVLFRELGSNASRGTREERQWMQALQAAGEDADMWRPKDWPERILAELRDLAPIEEAGVESPGSLNQTALAKMYAKQDHRTKVDRQKERQLARERRAARGK